MIRIIVYAIFSLFLIYMIHSIYSHFQKQIHIPLNVNPECSHVEEVMQEKEEKNQENSETNLEEYLNSL